MNHEAEIKEVVDRDRALCDARVDEAVQREREEIIKELEAENVLPTTREDLRTFKAGIEFACERIKARGGPKRIGKISEVGDNWKCMSSKINELIDAVNELREKP